MTRHKNAWNERLTDPLLNAVWQSNKNHASKLDTESWKKKWQSDCNHVWKSNPLYGQFPAKIADTFNDERAF